MSAILDGLPKLGPFYFYGRRRAALCQDQEVERILDRESGVTGWVFHDIRRTVRAAGWPMAEETAELVLNHAKKGLNKVYNPNRYLKEMRAAMEAWADHVAFIVGDGHDAANVVSFNDKHAVA